MADNLRIRTTSTQREAMVARLGQALHEGQLKPDEYAERVDAVHTTTYLRDLVPLLEGLFHPGLSAEAQLAEANIVVPKPPQPPAHVARPTKPVARRVDDDPWMKSDVYGIGGMLLAIIGFMGTFVSAGFDNGAAALGFFLALCLGGASVRRAVVLANRGQ